MRSEGWGAAGLVATWLFVAPAGAAAPTPPPRCVDGVAAAIGFDVVTRSLLEGYRAVCCPGLPPALALQTLVDERLLAAEARRYGLTPSPAALRESRARYPAPSGFRPAEWEQVIGDRTLATQFLAFRFGDFVPVGREEVAAYVAGHPELAALPREAREAEARARLVPLVRARREDAFKEELRLRAGVRTVEPPPSPE